MLWISLFSKGDSLWTCPNSKCVSFILCNFKLQSNIKAISSKKGEISPSHLVLLPPPLPLPHLPSLCHHQLLHDDQQLYLNIPPLSLLHLSTVASIPPYCHLLNPSLPFPHASAMFLGLLGNSKMMTESLQHQLSFLCSCKLQSVQVQVSLQQSDGFSEIWSLLLLFFFLLYLSTKMGLPQDFFFFFLVTLQPELK